MAYIGHRCACRHGDTSHNRDAKGKRSCGVGGCNVRCRRAETPELLPTFDGKGAAIERVVKPGNKLGLTDGEMNATTCDCDACVALHAELTGAEPQPA
jgi:hypothetical protein